MAQLSSKQLKELKECFNLFDSDGSGSISSNELKKVLEALGIKPKDSDIRMLMQNMDADNSGSIDFKEFINAMADHFYHKPSLNELEETFRHFDSDSSGYISELELYDIMKKFKPKISIDDVKRMIRSVDKNNDGQISLEEFVQIMSN